MTLMPGLIAEEFTEADVDRWNRIIGTARCPRCGGLMVAERCVDVLDDTGHINFIAGRCVQCGNLVDPVILHHRRVKPPQDLGMRGRSSKKTAC
jgi:hypothetical protein